MSVETQAANLATAVNGLVSAVNTAKGTLDTNVASAQTAHSATVAAYEGARTAADDAKADVDAVYKALRSAGSLASYQDLTAITGTTADTANDVFVYDTKQDSDGGAWRHRTSHTSWYNEELGTTTRGARREFPSVALIVAIDDAVIIYDGDDPTLPLWMKFWGSWSYASGRMLTLVQGSGLSPATCVTMLNGKLCVGSSNATSVSGLFIIDFFTERCRLAKSAGYNTLTNHPNIAARNDGLGVNPTNTLPGIVNGRVNDVAMTVLPDAPVDPATGLPIPTIAVATDGGVSVIKDDGSVSDHFFALNYGAVHFDENHTFFYGSENSQMRFATKELWANTGFRQSGSYRYTNSPASLFPNISSANGQNPVDVVSYGSVVATAMLHDTRGITQLAHRADDYTKSMVAYTTSTYNTGWMPGDIKGAFLADTSTSSLVANQVVTDPGFDTGTGWTVSNPANGTWTIANGVARCTSGSVVFLKAPPLITGKAYVLQFEVKNYVSGDARPYNDGSNAYLVNATGNGVHTVSFTATSATLKFVGYSTDDFDLDNVYIYEADFDRSVNNKGLIVNGTVTRSAVATGAELVAYSGFSTSNYLEQPYNSDLDFGTGDFCYMGWLSDFDNWRTVLRRGTNTAASFVIDPVATTTDARINVGGSAITTPCVHWTNDWRHMAVLRASGIVSIYVNGVLQSSFSALNNSLTVANATLRFGEQSTAYGSGSYSQGSLALWRISATAPTADQIKYIYEQERHLFKENAACTLYGNSDAVTGLAYDKTSGLLHVGTSSGRSTFQGLQRVDNTTTSVTTAISANDGVVIEQ